MILNVLVDKQYNIAAILRSSFYPRHYDNKKFKLNRMVICKKKMLETESLDSLKIIVALYHGLNVY